MPRFRQKPINEIDGKKIIKAPRPSFRKFLHLLQYPPHLIVSVNGSFQFAGLYAIYITFAKVWQEEFNFTTQQVGYAFLVPGASLVIVSVFVGKMSDKMRARAIKNSPDGKVAPERRIPIQIVGFIVAAVGKVMYGWFSKYQLNIAGGLFGSAFAAAGTAIIFVTSTSFQTECDPSQTASLVALGGLLRNIAAAIGSVIIDSLIKKMGYGWCFTGLAALDLLCIPGIILIMVKGAKFREQLNSKLKN